MNNNWIVTSPDMDYNLSICNDLLMGIVSRLKWLGLVLSRSAEGDYVGSKMVKRFATRLNVVNFFA